MMNLSKGQKVTLFVMNSMAMTMKYEIIVEKEEERSIICKLKGKRKLSRIYKEDVYLAFNDHAVPFKADSDTDVWRGNACINLVSDMPAKMVKKYIEENCINNPGAKEKGCILLFNREQGANSDYQETPENVLYPEMDIHHAVIDSAKRNVHV